MRKIPETDALEGFVSIASGCKAGAVTNLILSHGDNLGPIKPDAKNTPCVTTRQIANERSRLPVPYLYGGVVAAAHDPFFVHAHAPHKPSVGIRVTLEAKHPSLTGYGTVSTGAQNNSVATGVAHP